MDTPPFYRPISAQFCQGDIVERIPLPIVKDQWRPLKRITLPGNKEGFELTPLSPSGVASGSLVIATPCDYARAVLLTYDCEIDKPATKHLTFALIRRFAADRTEAEKEQIRQNSKFSFFHLPPTQDGEPEGYVDFRRLGTVAVELVKTATRVGCLSESARKSLLYQYYRFLTRIDLRQATLPPPVDELQG